MSELWHGTGTGAGTGRGFRAPRTFRALSWRPRPAAQVLHRVACPVGAGVEGSLAQAVQHPQVTQAVHTDTGCPGVGEFLAACRSHSDSLRARLSLVIRTVAHGASKSSSTTLSTMHEQSRHDGARDFYSARGRGGRCLSDRRDWPTRPQHVSEEPRLPCREWSAMTARSSSAAPPRVWMSSGGVRLRDVFPVAPAGAAEPAVLRPDPVAVDVNLDLPCLPRGERPSRP
jgi:hypothetical protein